MSDHMDQSTLGSVLNQIQSWLNNSELEKAESILEDLLASHGNDPKVLLSMQN